MTADWKDEYKRFMSNNILACIDGKDWDKSSSIHMGIEKNIDKILELNNKYTLFVGIGDNVPTSANFELNRKIQEHLENSSSKYARDIQISREEQQMEINTDVLLMKKGVYNLDGLGQIPDNTGSPTLPKPIKKSTIS